MKVQIVGQDFEDFAEKVKRHGFTLVTEHPEVIIAYGGDGAFIGAEREHPGIPKLGIRRDASCRKCSFHHDEAVLDRLRRGDLVREQLLKLEGLWNGERVLAVNDIILRNQDARSAVRFHVSLNGRRLSEEMIGDGIVACTPFGSAAYFRSITRTVLRVGIGIAFNNCTDPLNHYVVSETDEIRVALTRGPAALAADNDTTTRVLASGESLSVRRAETPAEVLAVDTLRCAECRYVNAPRRRY